MDGFDFGDIKEGIEKEIPPGEAEHELGFFRLQGGGNGLPYIHKISSKRICLRVPV
jgi:hypothetical protein